MRPTREFETTDSIPAEQQDTENACKQDVPRYPDGGWGWVVVVSCFFAFFMVSGLQSTYGVLYIEIQSHSDYAISELSWTGAFEMALLGLLSPVAGPMTRAVSCRILTIVGGVICSLGCLCVYFSQTLPAFYICLGLFQGIGHAIILTASSLIINEYFERRRNIAFSLALSGAGIGTVSLPPMISFVIQNVTYQNIFLVYGGICGIFLLCGSLYTPRLNIKDNETKISILESVRSIVDKEILMSAKFMCFFAANILMCSAYTTSMTFIPIKAASENLNLETSALLVTIFGAMNTIGRLGQGFVAQKYIKCQIPLYFISACILAGFLIGFVFSRTFVVMAILSAGVGFSTACFGAMYPALLVHMFGRSKLPKTLGLTLFAQGIGGLIGPTSAGMLNDHFGSSDVPFYFCLVCQVLSIMLLLSAFFLIRNKKEEHTLQIVTVNENILMYTVENEKPIWPLAA